MEKKIVKVEQEQLDDLLDLNFKIVAEIWNAYSKGSIARATLENVGNLLENMETKIKDMKYNGTNKEKKSLINIPLLTIGEFCQIAISINDNMFIPLCKINQDKEAEQFYEGQKKFAQIISNMVDDMMEDEEVENGKENNG